jgi:hypothetical protein
MWADGAKFINNNNDEHPIHIHVNDFQVMHYFDPTRGLETEPEISSGDNANVPPPAMGAEESVIQPGALSLRMKFDDFTGLFVMYCHRLNHEDNGLMTSGSRLEGGPKVYLAAADHTPVASFKPFDEASAVSVATTSTTTGADLLVSGVSPDKTVQVLKFELVRPDPDAARLEPKQLGRVLSGEGSLPNVLGGD